MISWLNFTLSVVAISWVLSPVGGFQKVYVTLFSRKVWLLEVAKRRTNVKGFFSFSCLINSVVWMFKAGGLILQKLSQKSNFCSTISVTTKSKSTFFGLQKVRFKSSHSSQVIEVPGFKLIPFLQNYQPGTWLKTFNI